MSEARDSREKWPQSDLILEDLNNDELFLVFSWLPFAERIRGQRVCKRWAQILQQLLRLQKAIVTNGKVPPISCPSHQSLLPFSDNIRSHFLRFKFNENPPIKCEMNDTVFRSILGHCLNLRAVHLIDIVVTNRSLALVGEGCPLLDCLILAFLKTFTSQGTLNSGLRCLVTAVGHRLRHLQIRFYRDKISRETVDFVADKCSALEVCQIENNEINLDEEVVHLERRVKELERILIAFGRNTDHLIKMSKLQGEKEKALEAEVEEGSRCERDVEHKKEEQEEDSDTQKDGRRGSHPAIKQQLSRSCENTNHFPRHRRQSNVTAPRFTQRTPQITPQSEAIQPQPQAQPSLVFQQQLHQQQLQYHQQQQLVGGYPQGINYDPGFLVPPNPMMPLGYNQLNHFNYPPIVFYNPMYMGQAQNQNINNGQAPLGMPQVACQYPFQYYRYY